MRSRRRRRASRIARSRSKRWPTKQPERFDVVTCMEMLEHVPDPASVVAACARLVKPGGWVFFSTINRNAKAFVFAIVGAEHVLKLLPKGTHEYARFLRPSELAAWCRDAAPRPRGNARPRIQPAQPALSAVGRHQRQLHGRVPQSRIEDETAGGPVRSRRHLDRQRTRPRRRLQRDARRARPAAAAATSDLRRMVGSGARGMVGTSFGLAPGDAGYLALRDEFLARYEARMTHETRVFAEMEPVLAWLRERGAAVGHRHQQGDPLRRAAGRIARPCRHGCRARLRRHRRPFQAASRAAPRSGAAAGACPPAIASMSATTSATSRPGGRRPWQRSSPPGATSARATHPRPGVPIT